MNDLFILWFLVPAFGMVMFAFIKLADYLSKKEVEGNEDLNEYINEKQDSAKKSRNSNVKREKYHEKRGKKSV